MYLVQLFLITKGACAIGMNVYKYNDYRDLIKYHLEQAGRGGHTRLSEVAGCQSSYLSQVLGGGTHLNVEQVIAIAKSWGLDTDDTDYFIALVQRDRASSRHARTYWEQKIALTAKNKKQLSERLSTRRLLNEEEQTKYFAVWFYPAIHTLSAVSELRSMKIMASRLGISFETVARAANDLAGMGLVSVEGDMITPVSFDIHARSSAHNVSYHNVWRNIASQRLQDRLPGENYHYTALYSLSASDVDKLKDLITEFINTTRKIVAPSKEETAVCLALDLFEL